MLQHTARKKWYMSHHEDEHFENPVDSADYHTIWAKYYNSYSWMKGIWGGIPLLNITKPPFKVTFSEVIIIWYNFSSTSAATKRTCSKSCSQSKASKPHLTSTCLSASMLLDIRRASKNQWFLPDNWGFTVGYWRCVLEKKLAGKWRKQRTKIQ